MKQQVLEKCLEEIATMASEAVSQPLWKQHEALISIWAKARCQLPLQKTKVVEADTQRQKLLIEHMYGQGG